MAYYSSVKLRGTVRWQAPELHDPDVHQQNSKASDIYAFACVCYEVGHPITSIVLQRLTESQMFSGHVPFYEQKVDSAVLLSILQQRRPARPLDELSKVRGLEHELWSIIVACWAHDPTKRPTAKQVVEFLHRLPNKHVDKRPLDNFNTNLPPQLLLSHIHHPFSALAAASYSVPVTCTSSSIPKLTQDHDILNIENEESVRDGDYKRGGKVCEPIGKGDAEGDDVFLPTLYEPFSNGHEAMD